MFKVCASLIHLPLICWNIDMVVNMIACFGIPLTISCSSINISELTRFDLHFLCESLVSIQEFIEVTFGQHCYLV